MQLQQGVHRCSEYRPNILCCVHSIHGIQRPAPRRRERSCDPDVDIYWKVRLNLRHDRQSQRVDSSPENVPEFLAAVKRREKVLSGFGHRVYKTVCVPTCL